MGHPSCSSSLRSLYVPAVHRMDDSCIAAHLGERAVRSLDPDAMSVMGPGQGGPRRGALSGDEEEDGGSGCGAAAGTVPSGIAGRKH